MKPKFIAVAGNMGAGKTTLVKKLSERFSWTAFYEQEEKNPYLADFYQDMKAWAFYSQCFFLGARLSSQGKIIKALNTQDSPVIQDRTIYEDGEVFARNLFQQGIIRARDWQTYALLYKEILKRLTPPDLVIYLRASVPTLMGRIKRERDRPYEREVSQEYIEQLNTLYEEWVEGFEECPVLIIPADSLDFVRYAKHLDFIAEHVALAIRGKTEIKFEDR